MFSVETVFIFPESSCKNASFKIKSALLRGRHPIQTVTCPGETEPTTPPTQCAAAQPYLWLVCCCEHGHLNVLPADWFGLARGRRPGGLLVVAANADEEEKQGDSQRDGHTGNQDIEDLHAAAAGLVFVVCRD